MGSNICRFRETSIYKLFTPNKKLPIIKILMLGLEGAGKTTILFRTRMGEVVTTIPTVGFNMDTIVYKNITFTVWDVGGGAHLRPYWRSQLSNVNAVIFVIDSGDRERIEEASKELIYLVESEELADAMFLVLANKQDLPHAMGPVEITDKLNLNLLLKGKTWNVHCASGVIREGIYEAFDWLTQALIATAAR